MQKSLLHFCLLPIFLLVSNKVVGEEFSKKMAITYQLMPRELSIERPQNRSDRGKITNNAPQGERLEFVNQMGGISIAVAISDRLIFVGCGPQLVVLDASDPVAPQYVSRLQLGDVPLQIQVVGSLAYVVTPDSGLCMVDVTNPRWPVFLGHYKSTGGAQAVQIVGTVAYLAGTMGFKIVDVQNPFAPKLLGSLSTTGNFVDIQVQGQYAYLADLYTDALVVVDVSNSKQPNKVSSYPSSNQVIRVLVNGNYAYIYESAKHWLRTLNISNPNKPVSVNITTTSTLHNLKLVNKRIYAASIDHGLAIFDATNPAKPILVDQLGLNSFEGACPDVIEKYAYVTDYNNNIRIIDCSNIASLQLVARWDDIVAGTADITISNANAFIAGTQNGLLILDVSNPTHITRLGKFVTENMYANRLCLSGSYVYLADTNFGLYIVDVSNPANPNAAGSLKLDPGGYDVVVKAPYAYITNSTGGLTVVDITNPNQPQKIASLKTADKARGIDVSGQYAFVADQNGGLRIINISNPNQPFEVGSNTELQNAYDVKVSGSYAYVVDSNKGFSILNISNPSLPKIVASVAQPIMPMCLFIQGTLAYVGGWEGVRVYDISAPLHPVLKAGPYRMMITPSMGLAVVEDLIYSAQSSFGLLILRQTAKPVSSVFLVTNTNDSGPGSLRQAITNAQNHAGTDSIQFAIPQADNGFNPEEGTWTIRPTSPLPFFTDSSTVVDGYSQKKSFGDANPQGPEIQLDGSLAGSDMAHGIAIFSGKNVVQGLIVNRFFHSGIMMSGPEASDNWIADNYVGVNAKGNQAFPNGGYGIYIVEGARNTIGQSVAILGKGTHLTGQTGSPEITNFGNIITGNSQAGIFIQGQVAKKTVIIGNCIGTDMSGVAVLPNGGHGIELVGSEVTESIITKNKISYNHGCGIYVNGKGSIHNRFTANSISGNDDAGIKLNGSNQGIQPPVLLNVTKNSISGTSGSNQRIELFSDAQDEGKMFLGNVQSDASGNFIWTGTPIGPNLTATATDANNNTSAFSTPFPCSVAAALLVTTTADTGYGSLRWAIEQANQQPGANTINFAIPAADAGYRSDLGVWTIKPRTKLPFFSDNSTIVDGRTQAQFIGSDTNPDGPEIEIDGSFVFAGNGLESFADGNEFFGLIVNRFKSSGIMFNQVDGGRVSDCFIGTDAKGQTAAGNLYGISISWRAKNVRIIQTDSLKFANLISGNIDANIFISDSCADNHVIGNIIGLNRASDGKLGNTFAGVYIASQSHDNKIFNNYIGGNKYGVYITFSQQNKIETNYIGTDSTWQVNFGNEKDGIYLDGDSQNNFISQNDIGYNGENGIKVFGDRALNNRLTKNRISKNGFAGIGEFFGGNNELIPPTIMAVSATLVRGIAGTGQEVEVYSDEEDEGRNYLGTAFADGNGRFALALSTPLSKSFITAITFDALGNTSKFSVPLATSVFTNDEEIPKDFFLNRNFPNPFNSSTTIEFSLPKPEHVNLSVYSILGEQITRLVQGSRQSGKYKIVWNAVDCGNGVYFILFEAGSYRQVRKAVLMK